MDCFGAYAQSSPIADPRLGVAVGLGHHHLAICEFRVQVRPWSQVLDSLDLAFQFTLRREG